MSKENLEQFMNQIAESEELQAKIGEEIDTEALIALGAECGCEFTAEAIAEYAELSDEELDGVAGGHRTREQRKADRLIRRLDRASRRMKRLWAKAREADEAANPGDYDDDADWTPVEINDNTMTP